MSTLLPGTLPRLLDVGAVVSRKDSPWQWVCVSAPYAVDTESPGIMVVRLHGGHCSAVDADIADLSLDLTIPANRDRAARYLAERVGLKVWSTAPGWSRAISYCAEDEWGQPAEHTRWPAGWWLSIGGSVVLFFTDAGWAVGNGPRYGLICRAESAPGISAATDPAEALALAILAVSK